MQSTASADPMEDRHGRILAELAGMGLELARDLRERALAAGTAEEATSLARAFQSISRGVRQTLALELKVARFRHELQRETQAARGAGAGIGAGTEAGTDRPEPAVLRRREAVAVEVERLIYCEEENEGLDDEAFDRNAAGRQHRLNAWLEAAAREPDFTAADIDWQIVEACEAVGVDPGRLYDFDAAPPMADEHEDQDAAAAPPPDPALPVPADTG